MRLLVSVVVPLVGLVCGNALGATNGLEPGQSEGAPGPITIASARFGTYCKSPSVDLTALYRQTCDGKWRCAISTSQQLSAEQQAIEQADRETNCGGARYFVDWTCGSGARKRSLWGAAGSRFRLSCSRPDGAKDEASGEAADSPEGKAAAAPLTKGGSSRGSAAAVHGRLLATSATGTADSTIVVSGRQTSIAQTGAFSLFSAPTTYDLSVIDKDGAKVTLFLGLSRRDPVVAHSEWQGGRRVDLARGASVSGRLAGPELTKADGHLRATLQFFSARKPLHRSDAGFLNRVRYPGDIDRNPISWRGPPTISGRLVATIYTEDQHNDCPLVGLASKPLTFEEGDSVFEDLTAVILSRGRIAGTWNPAENPQVSTLSVSYQLGDGSGELWVSACRLRDSMGRVLPARVGASPAADAARWQAFDCQLPDVSVLGGRYRVFLVEKYGSILEPEREHLTTCNIQMGEGGSATPCDQATHDDVASPVAITSQFTAPPHSQFTTITTASRFDWEPQKNSVYAIDLLPSGNRPFNLVPRISLFTRKTSFRWSDLATHGIGFPTGAFYVASVTSIPVSSVDQVASLDWWYGRGSGNGQPESKSSGVRLTDPAAAAPNPRAPSNVKDLKDFPFGLPVCDSKTKGEVLSAHSFGRMVTITGHLGRALGKCIHVLARKSAPNCSSYWAITDVAGSSLPISLVRPANSSRHDSPEPPVLVTASGLLTLDPRDQVPVLEQANLCLVQQ